FHSSVRQDSDGDSGTYPSAPSAPDYGGPPAMPEPGITEPRLVALRRALDSMGYSSVRFKMNGDTIVLSGTVPTEADRIMVQAQVFLVARIYSLEDHIQVRGTFADEP
ncbi:MAG TPA: hypothetical protein VEU51_16695, partial [Candidatus Acidoferrales bacterium]|nr:hypothetical protein [Candidatus Acidoferrales bacterium]